eukprot:7559260-Lingulodinium_polyedra.AAC.1
MRGRCGDVENEWELCVMWMEDVVWKRDAMNDVVAKRRVEVHEWRIHAKHRKRRKRMRKTRNSQVD